MRWGDYRRSENVEDRTGGMPEGRRRRDAAWRRHAHRRRRADRPGHRRHAVRHQSVRDARHAGRRRQRLLQAPPHANGAAGLRAANRRGCTVAPVGAGGRQQGLLECRPRRHRGRLGRDLQGDGRSATSRRSSCSIAAARARRAAARTRRSDRSTARPTTSSISTPRSSTNCTTRFGAPGDFAQAYVIAHEVGHHVQNLLGTMRQFDAQSQRADERTRNALSVRLELQADCYAGVWGFFSQKRNIIDAKDIESGLRAAAAVGDDQIKQGPAAGRTRSRTAPPSSARAGSGPGCNRATRAIATRSTRADAADAAGVASGSTFRGRAAGKERR